MRFSNVQSIIVISLLAQIVEGIRVPTSWSNGDQKKEKKTHNGNRSVIKRQNYLTNYPSRFGVEGNTEIPLQGNVLKSIDINDWVPIVVPFKYQPLEVKPDPLGNIERDYDKRPNLKLDLKQLPRKYYNLDERDEIDIDKAKDVAQNDNKNGLIPKIPQYVNEEYHPYGHNSKGKQQENKFFGLTYPNNYVLNQKYKKNPPQLEGNERANKIYRKKNTDYSKSRNFDDLQTPTVDLTPTQIKDRSRRKYIVNKNYRDDKLHEPEDADEYYDKEPVPQIIRSEEFKSDHEVPLDIPTAPIYPGEGLWAQRGTKHKPFISNHKYTQLENSEENPDGFEVFDGKSQDFDQKNARFRDDIKEFPKKHDLGKFIESENPEEEEDEEPSPFVPMKLYAQVRKSEKEDHLPSEDAEDPRLREVLKNSKIQTVYTEEGYEDSSYDHAGHEKLAENEEGNSKYDKEVNKEKIKHHPSEHEANREKNEIDNENEEQNDNDGSNTEGIDSETANSAYRTLKTPFNFRTQNNKNFISTEETKTMAMKETDRGMKEMEISSAIKVITSPGNGTKAHKYVKIFPKIFKYEILDEKKYQDPIETTTLTENTSGTEEIVTTTLQPIDNVETMTSNKFLSKNTEKASANTNTTSLSESDLKLTRKKRSNDLIPEIEIDTDFIDRINHTLPILSPDSSHLKYPYYKTPSSVLNENSPLRYSEHLNNIPQKYGGNMAFYDQTKNVECVETDEDIDALPDHLKDIEMQGQNEDTPKPKRKQPPKRLGKLGDKIDCLKIKYFGRNPFDSPFFKEETVSLAPPIFQTFKKVEKTGGFLMMPQSSLKTYSKSDVSDKRPIATRKYHSKFSLANIKNEVIKDPSIVDKLHLRNLLTNSEEEKIESKDVFNESEQLETNILAVAKDTVNQKTITTTVHPDVEVLDLQNFKLESYKVQMDEPTASLITTPKYTINMIPKHIYDQIELLKYLPTQELSEVEAITEGTTTTETPTSKVTEPINNNEAVHFLPTIPSPGRSRQGRLLDVDVTSIIPEMISRSDDPTKNSPTVKSRGGRVLDVTSVIPEMGITSDNPPKSEPLRKRRRKLRPRRPAFQIFDINRYYPSTTPIPYFEDILLGSYYPRYKTESEVHYKDEINSNEQLNVFSDVINNIKNSSNDPLLTAANYLNPVTAMLPSHNYNIKSIMSPRKVYTRNSVVGSYLNRVEEMNSFFLTTTTTTTAPTTTTEKPFRGKIKHKPPPKSTEELYEDYLIDQNNKEMNFGKKQNPKSTTTLEEIDEDETLSTESIDYVSETSTGVLGLVPPGKWHYKTIYNPKVSNKLPASVYSVIEEAELNKFFVPGMKPPSANQKVFSYNDFKHNDQKNTFRRRYQRHPLRRGKRSPHRPYYADVNRDGDADKEDTVKIDEADDYVPHRSKNYHYDEKTKRIVYDNVDVKKEEPDEELETVEYEMEEEPSIQQTTTRRPHTTAQTITGPSYIDFVKLLKSNKNYISIPDPTTTEKNKDEVNTTTTTMKPISTTPPEFLGFLEKLRSNAGYKKIGDKTTTSRTTSTEAYIEEVDQDEYIEESQDQHVQNSPGESAINVGQNLQIFDINDYMPKFKSYTPRTSIDYSKYKNIERSTIKPAQSTPDDIEESSIETATLKPTIEDESSVSELIEQTIIESTTEKFASTTQKVMEKVTTPIVVRTRGRLRTTTSTPRSATTQDGSDIIEPSAQFDKPKRVYQRRRPTRIKLRTTTAKSSVGIDSDKEESKIVRRRHQPQIPGSLFFQPIVVEDLETQDNETTSTMATTAKSVDKARKEVTTVSTPTAEVTGRRNFRGTKQPATTSKPTVSVLSKFEKRPQTIITSQRVLEIVRPNAEYSAKYKKPEVKEQMYVDSKKYESQSVAPKRMPDVEVLHKFDKHQQHGGNYRKNVHEETRSLMSENVTELNKELPTVDVNILGSINQLKVVDVLDQIPDYADKEDDELGDDYNVRRNDDVDYAYDDVKIDFEERVTTTKRPIFIKDPSKRQYYYVPT